MLVPVIEKQVLPKSASSWSGWYAILKPSDFPSDISKHLNLLRAFTKNVINPVFICVQFTFILLKLKVI